VNVKMKKNFVIALIIIFIIVVVIMGILIKKHSKKPMYWIDTMEPTIHYPGPGNSRMGMTLVPVYADEDTEQSSVKVSSTAINNLSIRTVPVTQGTLSRRIEAVGYIEPNENKISHIHSYTDGWVKKLLVTTVGAVVKKDQILLQLYSPMLVTAQEEYLISLESGDKDLADASIKKLQALHLSPQQIQELIKTKKASELVDFNSPQDGVVAGLNVREGMRITPDTEMMSLVDLSSIWMIVQVFENQTGLVNVGEHAEARLSAFPGKVWKGEVDYIYPEVDPMTRTLKLRLKFNNPEGILKPNMYANVSLFGQAKSNVLSIPLEALIRSSQGNRVVVALGNGRFQVRNVTIGMESGDQVEILSGLVAGEHVVASGQFLIDSEANLKAGLERTS
jgi:Cu(I)/Ag(I) efflux system membrane fusion protein